MTTEALHLSDVFKSANGGIYKVVYADTTPIQLAEVIQHKTMKPGMRLPLTWVTADGYEVVNEVSASSASARY